MIPIFMPYLSPLLNSIYAGVHWATRKKHAAAAHRATQIATRGLEPITRPVRLTLQPVLGKGKRRLDCSNYGYTLKLRRFETDIYNHYGNKPAAIKIKHLHVFRSKLHIFIY